jgi:UDP-GlcNAc:undecaprenyl-phosphate GlcNAc-1-phosphate transferase
MAVIRRSLRGQSPFAPDKMHLHHRLLALGHTHRRAVLVMYFWAALLSFGAVALSITGGRVELVVAIGVLLLVGIVVVLSPRTSRTARAARAAALAAARTRSRANHPTAHARRSVPTGSTAAGTIAARGSGEDDVGTTGGTTTGGTGRPATPQADPVPGGARQVAR